MTKLRPRGPRLEPGQALTNGQAGTCYHPSSHARTLGTGEGQKGPYELSPRPVDQCGNKDAKCEYPTQHQSASNKTALAEHSWAPQGSIRAALELRASLVRGSSCCWLTEN